MSYASSALLSHDERDREANLLVELVRLSPATVLLAEEGAEKSAFLKSSVMPLFDAAPHSEHSQVCVVFDAWDEHPLPALLAAIRRAIPGLDVRRAGQSEPSKSLPATLARWQHALQASFLIVFDRFEDYLAARDEPGAAEFEDEVVRVLKTPELRTHFLIALDEHAAPLLEPLRSKIPGLGDALIRLPRASNGAPQTLEEMPERRVSGALIGSPPLEKSSLSNVDETPAVDAGDFGALAGSQAKPRDIPEFAFETEPIAEDPARREPVLSKLAPEEIEQFNPAASLDAPQAPSNSGVQAQTRVPAGAWAVLGLVLVSALGLLVSTLWQPRPAVVEQAAVTSATARVAATEQPADTNMPTETHLAADDTPPPSPADDQVPLPSIKDEVPRKPASARGASTDSAQVSPTPQPIASVYINVHSEAERAAAGRLVQPLARRGIRVAGIRVVQGGPASAQLQYFRPEEAAQAARVARALSEARLPRPRVSRIRGLESRSLPRHYELWLPSGVERPAR